jgi:hypothetical protein
VVLGALAALAHLPNNIPEGFVPATVTISASAVAFLASISWLRRRQPLGPDATLEAREADDQRHHRQIAFFTVGLFLVALLVAGAVWISLYRTVSWLDGCRLFRVRGDFGAHELFQFRGRLGGQQQGIR